MRVLFATVLLATSLTASGYECAEVDPRSPLEQHLALATDVALGRVIGGEVDEASAEDSNVRVVVGVIHRFKGHLPEEVELRTGGAPPYFELSLGGSYIFFLYESRYVDFCSLVIPVAPVTTLAELEDRSAYLNSMYSSGEMEPDRFWLLTHELLQRLSVGP